MLSDFKFELGCVVKDSVTHFEGVVISRSQWLNNCNTYGVKPRVLKDGAPQDSHGFDEPQLSLISGSVLKANRETGGPSRKAL